MKKLFLLLISITVLSACHPVLAQTVPPSPPQNGAYINPTLQNAMNRIQPYTKHVSRVTQSSTTAPVDTELEQNMAHAFTMVYIKVGDYRAKCAGCFDTKKTVVFPGNAVANTIIRAWVISADSVGIQTRDTSGVLTNALLTNTPFEFRTYP